MLNVKEAIQDMGGADVVAKLIPGATKNIVYHWSSANRVGPRFYLRFLELCNKMKIKVDPIKVMNGDKMTDIMAGRLRSKCKHEIHNDHFQNFKRYALPKAQLVIADIPYNIGKNAYGSNPSWYIGGDSKTGKTSLLALSF